MNIIEELKIITEKLGHFPKQIELKSLKRNDILRLIYKSGSTLQEYAIHLGCKPKRKPRKYWTEEKIIEELQRICELHNGWPTVEMWKDTYAYLKVAIYRTHSIKYYREKLEINNTVGLKNKVCLHCDKIFMPRASTNTKQKFCSHYCLYHYRRIERNERNACIRSQPKICPICNKTFIPSKTTQQLYCGRRCPLNFRKRMAKAVRRCYETLGTKKEDTCSNILGYSALDLLAHLKTNASWAELQQKKWDLDHIFPIKAFVEHGIKDIKLICALDNLQILSREENNAKGDKYDKVAFLDWLSSKSVAIPTNYPIPA